MVAAIAGAATFLGNPVDLAVQAGSLYVAEKSNDRILRYDNIAILTGDISVAANQEAAVLKPESVFVLFE